MNDKDIIKKITGISPVECSCNNCVDMCHKAPCIPTPLEVVELMDKGFKYGLANTVLNAGIVKHTFGFDAIKIISPIFDNKKGHCIFLENNLCKLHDLGLKPSEGVFADCKRKEAEEGKPTPLQVILNMWLPYQNIL